MFVIITTFVRARTQELEQQQPGVEGELRRLLEKPGKAAFADPRPGVPPPGKASDPLEQIT